MKYRTEFLKINQDKDLSFAEFITEYDLQNNTMHSLMLNYEEELYNILLDISEQFLENIDVANIISTKEKVFKILEMYPLFLCDNNINYAVLKVQKYLKTHSLKLYIKYLYHFADAIWKKIDIYDSDHNFFTRRMRLQYLLYKSIN